jgi:hypothetical protein
MSTYGFRGLKQTDFRLLPWLLREIQSRISSGRQRVALLCGQKGMAKRLRSALLSRADLSSFAPARCYEPIEPTVQSVSERALPGL